MVWWFGEGLGGIVTGGANPITGAPGAVLIYVLLAVLLWPVPSARPRRVVRRREVHRHRRGAAGVAGAVGWPGLFHAANRANRTPQALHDTIAGLESGEPSWIATIDRNVADVLAHHGLAVSIILAIVLLVVAFGVFLAHGGRAA